MQIQTPVQRSSVSPAASPAAPAPAAQAKAASAASASSADTYSAAARKPVEARPAPDLDSLRRARSDKRLGLVSSAAPVANDPNAGVKDGTIELVRPQSSTPVSKLDAFSANSKLYYLNGVGDAADSRRRMSQAVADALGKEVNLVHNNTEGMLPDVKESILQMALHHSNPPTDALASSLHEDLSKLLKRESTQNVSILAHSQGGIIATAALGSAIEQLRHDGWKDEQIRDVVSQHVQVNLMGSPVEPKASALNGQPLSTVPPSIIPFPWLKPLSYFFGGDKNLHDFVTDGVQPPKIPGGPGFNTVRNPHDPVATMVHDLGRDDLFKIARSPGGYALQTLARWVTDKMEPSAHAAHGPTGYLHTISSSYLEGPAGIRA